MTNGKVILVTGGCGYLGSQLIRDLAQDEHLGAVTVRVLDNMADAVLHLAAVVSAPMGYGNPIRMS